MTQSMKRNPKRKKNISKTTRKYENINNHKLIEKNIFPNAYSDSILFYALCSTHLNTNDDDTQQRAIQSIDSFFSIVSFVQVIIIM